METFLPFSDWHHTAEGETFLQHLYNVKSTGRKLFGILERPFLSSNLEEVSYKLVFVGKTGIGKTSTINRLSGYSVGSAYSETNGIQITDVYWPIKVWNKVILFKLQCWDAGNNSMKKFNHIPFSCMDKADFVVFVFSYNDGSSFFEIPHLINKFIGNNDSHPGSMVIGVRDMLKTEVNKCEVKEFEQKHNIPVLSIQNIPYTGPNEAMKIAPILNAICEKLWLRDQQYILRQGAKV